MKAEDPTIKDSFKNIKSWKGCAKKCKADTECKFWSLKKVRDKTKCLILSKYSGFEEDKYMISGTSDCPQDDDETPISCPSNSNRIMNGFKANTDNNNRIVDAPFMSAILEKPPRGHLFNHNQAICGGALINERIIL